MVGCGIGVILVPQDSGTLSCKVATNHILVAVQLQKVEADSNSETPSLNWLHTTLSVQRAQQPP